MFKITFGEDVLTLKSAPLEPVVILTAPVNPFKEGRPVFAMVIEPLPFVTDIPLPAVIVANVNPEPLPISILPLAALDALYPVPPFATGNTPDTSEVKLIVDELVKALPVVFRNPADNKSMPFKKPSIVVVILELSMIAPPEDTITLLLPSIAVLLVPPFAIVTVGKSAANKALNVGVPLDPFGLTNTLLADWLERDKVILPLPVIGLLPTTKILVLSVIPTEVTLPVPLPRVAMTVSNEVQLAST
jgi:hypothetical protein